MNRQQRRQAKASPQHPPIPATWAETLERCPFRSFVGIGQHPGNRDEMAERLDHVFAALGGEVTPIAEDLLAEMVDSIQRSRTVLVLSDRADLRNAAKGQILTALAAAAVGAAGSA